jgi:hypothetical protein
MSDADAIVMAVFEDEPGSAMIHTLPNELRPELAAHAPTEQMALVVVDSEPPTESILNGKTAREGQAVREQPTLAFDIGLFDPTAATFLVVYAAGTALTALKPRTVSLPTDETGAPVATITLFARSSRASQPTPFLTLPCPEDVRGRPMTLQFAKAGDPRSLELAGQPSNGDQQS